MTSRLRKAPYVLGVGIALALAAVTALHPRARPPLPQRHDYFPPPHLARDGRFRIVAFGSSSTHGYGASGPTATYPAQLQALFDQAGLSVDVVNRGIDGEDAQAMLRRLDDDILPRAPDLVVWQLGSNDALHGMPRALFAQRLQDGILRIRAAGCALVLVGPQWNPDPERAAQFGAMNETMTAASRTFGLPMVDRYTLMQRWVADGTLDRASLVGADGLHMTDRGYALLARAVFDVLSAGVPALQARLAVGSG